MALSAFCCVGRPDMNGVLIGYGLIMGLQVSPLVQVERAWALINVPVPPPKPKPETKAVHRVAKAAGYKPSPPNLRNKATPIVAPPQRVLLPPPVPPVIAASAPNVSMAAQTGASDRPGPGQGAGGEVNGNGGGGDGAGDIPPIQIKGRLKYSDLPPYIRAAGAGATVGVKYSVESDCRITRSSGRAELDQLTCQLIRQRFRFKPSRDGGGEPVRSYIVENHSWEIDRCDYDEPPPRS